MRHLSSGCHVAGVTGPPSSYPIHLDRRRSGAKADRGLVARDPGYQALASASCVRNARAISGEFNFQKVVAVNARIRNIDDPVGGGTYTLYPAVIVQSSGYPICAGGDSGGPVFQRTPNKSPNINAVGTISASSDD